MAIFSRQHLPEKEKKQNKTKQKNKKKVFPSPLPPPSKRNTQYNLLFYVGASGIQIPQQPH